MMRMPIVLTIPAMPEYLDIVRGSLYALAGKAGFSYEEIEDMKVAVTEACTNAIIHGYNNSNDGLIQLTLLWDSNELRISIKDFGQRIDSSASFVSSPTLHNTPIAEATVGGLGIFMMQALMDEVYVRSENGTEVVLIKRMSRSEEMV